MGLSSDHIAVIQTLLADEAASDSSISELRKGLAGLTLTRCDLADIDHETPYGVFPKYTVFLVDASDHCWVFTTDPARATGVVVAANRGAS